MLDIVNLTRRFDGQTVLDGISLQVPQGKVACLVGPSGCGKSTLLRLVAGLDRPDSGEIRAEGRLLSSPGWALEPRKRGLNMVFQDYALWPHMTVERIVGYGLNRLPAAERAARVSALLERMHVAPLARRLPSQISGGQQQRVAIARALATDPAMLLLDEPLSNLDVQLRIEMRREFASLFAELGKTVLYVTHDPLEASAFADTLVVMQAGRIEQQGPPEALFTRPRSRWIATLAGYDSRLRGEVIATTQDGDWHIRIAGQDIALPPPEGAQADYRGPVTVMLRGDVPQQSAGLNRLTGTVAASLYEGSGWRTDIELAPGQTATVILPGRVRAGQRMTIELGAGAALAFPDDEQNA